MYKLEEILKLINNLDKREALRKFGPTWSVVVVNKNLQVEGIVRFKNEPSIEEISAVMLKHRGCVYFYAHPGMYNSIEKLKIKIKSCKDAFDDSITIGDRPR
ncbi:MAG: hypothetical protein ACKE51_02590 [Methylococcaceae bacterium]